MSHHAHAALAVVGALMSACAAMDENDAVAGLDGVLNIDLGRRSRTLRQRGRLQARSQAEMSDRIAAS